MQQLGWIGSQRPRMVLVQSATCAPIVRAFDNGVDLAATDVGGLTPKDLALMKGHVGTAALIDTLLAQQSQ